MVTFSRFTRCAKMFSILHTTRTSLSSETISSNAEITSRPIRAPEVWCSTSVPSTTTALASFFRAGRELERTSQRTPCVAVKRRLTCSRALGDRPGVCSPNLERHRTDKMYRRLLRTGTWPTLWRASTEQSVSIMSVSNCCVGLRGNV